ncbi:MAG: hypothetical protein ACLR06_13920 [Christensenellaceae bacterium]
MRIVERGYTEIVGTFWKDKNAGCLHPDEKKYFEDIYIPLSKCFNIPDGVKAVARITEYPFGRAPAARSSRFWAKETTFSPRSFRLSVPISSARSFPRG